MIDGIGKASGGRLELVRGSLDRSSSVGKAGEAAANRAVGGPWSLAAEMAAGAPVDAAKVAAIREAIADGRYPVDPKKIAQSMLELDLPVKSNA
jgi:negative regulator of flagellin synthesis FlgM